MARQCMFWGAATAFALASAGFLPAQSELWGESGELWDAKGLLPDFSFAGYRRGEASIPERAPEVWVTDFGAKPDSEEDATEAFRKAISASPGKCIGVPEGRFVLSDRIRITEKGTVLRGAGPGRTVLHFTRGLQEIEPTKAFNGGGFETNQWSWSGGLIIVGKSGDGAGGWRGITATAARGDTVVAVDAPADFEKGQEVVIEAQDDEQGSLTNYLYRGDPGDAESILGKTSMRQVARVTGAGEGGVQLDRPLRTDLKPEWSPRIKRFDPVSQDCGLENLTIDFPPRPYRGHWMEDGLNGVEVKGTHNWVRDVVIHNSDSGIYMSGQFNTMAGVTLTADRREHDTGMTGHHGLSVGGQDNLVTRFRFETRFFHDVTLESCAMGHVFSEGSGVDVCFDHHRVAPYENLFTSIDLGQGTRPWLSGGTAGKGLHTASGAVFWNIDSKDRFALPAPGFGPPGLVFVGLNSGTVRKSDLKEGWHFEKLRPGGFEPANLHAAQLQRRLKGGGGAGPGPAVAGAPAAPKFMSWTNTGGASIEAAFLGLSGTSVQLRMRDGKTYDYPLEKLTPESREQARRLAAP